MGFLFCPKDCPDRKPACHSTCQDYKDRKAEYNRLMAIENKEKTTRIYVAESIRRRKDLVAKRRHLRPGRGR